MSARLSCVRAEQPVKLRPFAACRKPPDFVAPIVEQGIENASFCSVKSHRLSATHHHGAASIIDLSKNRQPMAASKGVIKMTVLAKLERFATSTRERFRKGLRVSFMPG